MSRFKRRIHLFAPRSWFMAVALTIAAFLAGTANGLPYAESVIAFQGFPQRGDRGMEPDNPEDILGPQNRQPVRIGSGGEIVVDMGGPVINGPGPDFKVYESGAPENYWVLGAQRPGGPWLLISYAKGSAEFDLEGSPFPWVRYLSLTDLECIDEGEASEPADFDAIEAYYEPLPGVPLAPPLDPKGRLLFGKWRYDGRFNTKPRALDNLAKACDRALQMPIASLTDYVDSENEELFFSCPIIVLAGHRDFILTDDQRKALREYVDRGGFVLGDACCGNLAFATALQREMQLTFPELRFERLSPDHEIFHLMNDVDGRIYRLDGMMRGDRAAVVLSPYGLICAWEGERCLGTHPVVPPAGAMDLGVNIVVYALTR